MSSNLLMVDWDYFFYNPLYAVDGDHPDFWLYDWGHAERSLFIDHAWPTRASAFFRHGSGLPQVEVPPDWWSRFTIAPDARVEVSDSNMYSGIAGGGQDFKNVYLYDAHHDLYRVETPQELEDWAEQGQITCEDWMWAHHLRGSKLHWRWPQWFTYGPQMRKEIPSWVKCDSRKDDGKTPPVTFDVVSICRSGAWVPPWCDPAFQQFYESCPGGDIVQVDDVPLVRTWDEELPRHMAKLYDEQMKQLATGNANSFVNAKLSP